MARYISLGKYYHKYKIMIIYLVTMTPFYYLFFSDDIRIPFLEDEKFPIPIVVYEIFRYFGTFIFGIIVYKFELGNKLAGNEKKKSDEETNNKFKLIVSDEKEQISQVSILRMALFLSIFLILLKIIDILYVLGLLDLNFWMAELLFVILNKILFFKTTIYLHQKLALFISSVFPFLLKIILIIILFKERNDSKKSQESQGINSSNIRLETFIEYPWVTPIGIILFLLIYFSESFIVCKLKWYFDLRFISESKMLIIYGILGTVIFLLWSIIVNFIKCNEDAFSKKICIVSEGSEFYFDNFIIFFKNIWREERSAFENIGYIILLILRIAISAYQYFLVFLIIKVLGPEYYIFAHWLCNIIVDIIRFIYKIIVNEFGNDFILNFVAEIISILGIIIYFEFIELNFCNLNKDINRNINKRAVGESTEMLNQIEDDKNDDDELD